MEDRGSVRLTHPGWARSATLYQLNTRQFTSEGTFRAAMAQLPRIRALGADIVWLMPIHEIGTARRKGSLGSPYAVKDHYSVNPEFGTLEDLRAFVDAAQALDLRVILDWVANHTAWDHVLVREHPDWYERGRNGNFRPTPWCDWTDIIDLDYRQPGLRRYMAEAMTYWVAEVGVDGFRCDVAGFVPVDFWNAVRRELDAVRPVFLLAEAEARDLHVEAFDATYAWSWDDTMQRIASGRAGVDALHEYYAGNESAWPDDAMRMTFVSNHDRNAWDGTPFERFGDALEAAIVLSVVGDGMPLIHNGQEAGNPRRLAFFERDPIDWRPHPIGELYRHLFALKHETRALANGAWGAPMLQVPNDAELQVLSFVREGDRDGIFAVLNLSESSREVAFRDTLHHGRWEDAFSGASVPVDEDTRMALDAWGWRVLVRRRAA